MRSGGVLSISHDTLDLIAQYLQAVAILAVVWSAWEQRKQRKVTDPTDPSEGGVDKSLKDR